MRVPVVQIGDVGVGVLEGFVAVTVGVPGRLVGVVTVVVVAVVVHVLVVVFDRVVAVLVEVMGAEDA